MFYKRPSLRRGGMPTGIEQLTPRIKAFNGFPGFQFLEPGVQQEMRTQMKPPSGQGLTRGSRGARFLTQVRPMSLPSFSTAATLAAPFIPTGIMAYTNRPRTTEALKVMKNEPSSTFDETGLFEYEDFVKKIDKANKEGEEISFLDAFLMNPETGTYPKAMGRTEDRNIKKEIEKAEEGKSSINTNMRGDPAQFSGEDEVTDFDAIAKKMIANKNEVKSKDTQVGGEVVEDSFDSEYDKQMKRLEKYLGTNNRETKGKLALALSDAVGTEGTIADKAAALNKSLLGIMGQKRKDKKDMAKIAFAATTELEKAKIAAGKKGFTERRFDEYANLASKKDRTKSEESRFQILKNGLGIKTGLTGQTATAAEKLAQNIRKDIVNMSESPDDQKSKYQADIIGRINALLLLQGVTKDNINGIVGYDVSPYLGVKKAEGGRIEMAVGGPTETPTEPVATNLTFEQLRTRLPKEITDDVVKLVATSEEALQDFAYIRTQGDVEKFNVKYGVNLILPQNTA